MSNYVRTYRFLGVGIIWDAEENRPLCKFNKEGVFETSDPAIIRKLIKMRVPYDDGQADALSNAEYAIELLTERVNILEKMNEELQWKLETHKKQAEVDSAPSRDALIAELDFYGIPYVANAQDKTLQFMLEDYERYMRLQSKGRLGSVEDIAEDKDI